MPNAGTITLAQRTTPPSSPSTGKWNFYSDSISVKVQDEYGVSYSLAWNRHNQDIATGTTVTIEADQSAILAGGYTVSGTLNVYGKLVVL